MSFPIMRCTLALLAALVVATACGDAGALDEDARRELDAARDASERAQNEIAALEDRVGELEADLEGARTGRKKIAGRLTKLGRGLRASLDRLRTALDDARESAVSASASAGDAVDRAASIAKELAVLEQRYDYHLRRYHGGG